MTTTEDLITERLHATFEGQLVLPGDARYDAARTVVAGHVDRRPAVIVQPTDPAGVASAVTFARETGLPLAVRSGGHSGAGHGVVDDGIVLDVRRLTALEVDVEARTAWAGAGLTAGDYTTAVGAHGLATGFGDTGSVGLGGIVLGGGVGFLSRKHGLTIDNLLAAELVTAEGEVLVVDADHHPELFWAIRGGGGNFGVATRFKLRLHDVPEVYGGMLLLPATAEVVSSFLTLADEAPEELTTILNVMSAPPVPFLPEEVHGSIVAMALVCHAGPAADGERVLAPFRALATPLADMLAPMPYAAMFQPEEPGYRPTAVARTMFTGAVDRDTAAAVIDRLAASDAPLRAVQLRVLGGAISHVPADATAYAHRSSRIMANVAAFYESDETKSVRQAWVEEVSGLLHQDDDGAYVNFLADDGPDRVRDAYPGATWDRLVEVKRRHDPTNLFRLNVNIPPDGTS